MKKKCGSYVIITKTMKIFMKTLFQIQNQRLNTLFGRNMEDT